MAQPGGNLGVIAYADLPARLGISYEVLPEGTWIEIPAVYSSAIAWAVGVMVTGGIMGVAVLLGAWAPQIVQRLRGTFKPVRIDISESALAISNAYRDLRDVVLPRQAIYELKYVGHSGNIVIHAKGHEMVELRPVRNERALRWLAQVMREAVGLSREEGAGGELEGEQNARE